MKKITSKGKTSWVLTKWFEKAVYILGKMFIIYFTLIFIAGFLIGLMGG